MAAPLNIVHVLTSLHIGGGERVALDLARLQHRRGHRVLVISLESPEDGPLAAELTRAGVPVRRIAKKPRGLDPTLPLRLAARFARSRADVIHTHNPLPLIYAALPGRVVGARVIHTKHGANAASARSRALRRQAAQLVHAFVAVSAQTAEEARAQRDAPKDRLQVIANGIDLSRFGPDDDMRRRVRRELGIGEEPWVVGSVGRVVALKNHTLLLQAVEPLLDDSFQLVIAGDGPAMSTLRELRDRVRRRDCVHLLGARRDIPDLLTGFDVFALSSDSEGLPLVVPEAMATALPVVCTAVGGLPGVIDDGETGYLVPARDEESLRARLDELRRHPERARAFGARARQTALSRYSCERMVAEYEALYRG